MKIAVLLAVGLACFSLGDSLRFTKNDFRFGKLRHQTIPPPIALKNAKAPVLNWLDQKLDHFSPTDMNIWKQKYYSNDQYYSEGGPIFVFIGGEGPASPGWVSGGHMMELAEKYGAAAFEIEHRFYGESQPTVDTSVESMRYLTTEQALADVAFLIRYLRSTTYPTGKLIVFGGSYAGNLAAWAQLRYPHLIDGAVASSAPVLAQVDYPEYYEVVATAMDMSDTNCLRDIKTASDEVTSILNGPQGAEKITELFNLCSPLDKNNKMDVSSFYSAFSNIYAGVVQYAESVQEVGIWCSLMTDEAYGATPLDRYIELARLFDNMGLFSEAQSASQGFKVLECRNEFVVQFDLKGILTTSIQGAEYSPPHYPVCNISYLEFDGCFDQTYAPFIDYMVSTSWDSDASQSGTRQWFYQTCTEYGYYQTSAANKQPFGDFFNIDYFLQWCPDFYSPAFTADFVYDAANNTNLYFGGLNPQVENVVFVHGSIDPWHVLGVLEDLSDSVPVVLIEGSAHCADMSTSTIFDSSALKGAKAQINALVGKWLGQ